MKDKSLLNAIFNGDYAPFTDVIPTSMEYIKARDELNKEWEFFEKMIPDEHKARFDELMALFHNVSGYVSYEFYKEGFRAGFKLVNELSE